MFWLYYILLLLLQLFGLAINVVTLPGLWLMLGAAFLYAWVTHWDYVGLWTLLALLLLSIVAEIIEFMAGGAGAKKVGGSARAAWGSIIGGIAGALFLTIPLPLIGTLIGLCIGVFVGAAVAQFTVQADTQHSLEVGWGATKGKLLGILIKVGFGVAMLLITSIKALPLGAAATPVPATTSPATTSPATTTAVR